MLQRYFSHLLLQDNCSLLHFFILPLVELQRSFLLLGLFKKHTHVNGCMLIQFFENLLLILLELAKLGFKSLQKQSLLLGIDFQPSSLRLVIDFLRLKLCIELFNLLVQRINIAIFPQTDLLLDPPLLFLGGEGCFGLLTFLLELLKLG